MPSNLKNIYAKLLEKYGKMYTISHIYAPTYLSTIVGHNENEKIIYFYIEDCHKVKCHKHEIPNEFVGDINNASANLDLTGSPLKDNFLTDCLRDLTLDIKLETSNNPWKVEEEYHKGLCVERVRSIICTTDFQGAFDNKEENKGSVWFLCLANDFMRTLFLQYEYLTNAFSRGIVHYMGVIPSNDITTKSILEKHYKVISKDQAIESQIENTYRLKRNMSIHCSWTTGSSSPNLINLNTCDAILKQTFYVNDCNLFTQDFLTQLRILMTIRDDIMSYKESERLDNAKEPTYRCGIGIELSEVRESINKAMLEIAYMVVPTSSEDNGSNDIEKIAQKVSKRCLNDLTDKLWEILKRCSNYKDLKQSFNILFQCAVRCNIVNTPATNKNRLAEIITEVANHRLAVPMLSGSEPLELLLEIGLDKLYKDYEYIFVESQIYSANDFQQLCTNYEQREENDGTVFNVRKSLRNAANRAENTNVRKTLLQCDAKMIIKEASNDALWFQNSNFNKLQTAKTIAKLFQIHCTLEHLLMIHINLNIPNVYRDICNQLLNKPLRMIDNLNDSTLHDEVDIQLSPHNVRDYLMDKEPHSRRITIKSSTKYRQVTTILYYNMENICPPNVMESITMEGQECSKDETYHCWLYHKLINFQSV